MSITDLVDSSKVEPGWTDRLPLTKDPTRLQNRDKAVVNCHSGGSQWAKSRSLTNRAIPESPSVKDLVCAFVSASA